MNVIKTDIEGVLIGEEFFLETTKYNPTLHILHPRQAQTTLSLLSTIHTVCLPS